MLVTEQLSVEQSDLSALLKGTSVVLIIEGQLLLHFLQLDLSLLKRQLKYQLRVSNW